MAQEYLPSTPREHVEEGYDSSSIPDAAFAALEKHFGERKPLGTYPYQKKGIYGIDVWYYDEGLHKKKDTFSFNSVQEARDVCDKNPEQAWMVIGKMASEARVQRGPYKKRAAQSPTRPAKSPSHSPPPSPGQKRPSGSAGTEPKVQKSTSEKPEMQGPTTEADVFNFFGGEAAAQASKMEAIVEECELSDLPHIPRSVSKTSDVIAVQELSTLYPSPPAVYRLNLLDHEQPPEHLQNVELRVVRPEDLNDFLRCVLAFHFVLRTHAAGQLPPLEDILVTFLHVNPLFVGIGACALAGKASASTYVPKQTAVELLCCEPLITRAAHTAQNLYSRVTGQNMAPFPSDLHGRRIVVQTRGAAQYGAVTNLQEYRYLHDGMYMNQPYAQAPGNLRRGYAGPQIGTFAGVLDMFQSQPGPALPASLNVAPAGWGNDPFGVDGWNAVQYTLLPGERKTADDDSSESGDA